MGMSNRLLRPRQSGFNPRSLAGLQVWLDGSDAASMTLNGSTVSVWKDKSGNGRDAIQSTAVNQFTYATNQRNGLSALIGDGTRFMEVAAFPVSQYSFGVGVVMFSAVNSSMYQRGTVNDRHSVFLESAALRGRVASAINANQPSYSLNTFYVVAWSNDISPIGGGTSTATLRLNKAEVTASAPNTITTANRILTVGALNSTTYRLNGTLCEILYYERSTAPTSVEIATLESYASRKWGITL